MSKELTTTTPQGIVIKGAALKEFDTARKHLANIIEHGRRTNHEAILFGLELLRLKASHGVKQGGDRKSSLHAANLIPWTELVESQTGQSYATCQRCMQFADASKKHIPILTSPDVLQKPFSALPEARQKEVLRTLEKAADGQSMNQLMHAFGAWKDKKKASPPKATSASAKKRAANAADETLTAAALLEAGREMISSLETFLLSFSECKKALGLEELAAWENAASAHVTAVREEIKARKKA